ncbi:MAG: VOC family protein [Pseudomonadota bacterium]
MSSPPFNLVQLDHVVLRVMDMPRALAFYCGVLGCSEERRVPQFGLVQLRAGAALIDLLDISQRPGAGPATKDARNMDHFALTILPFDAAAIRAHLAANGVDCGALEQRYGAQGTGPSLYIHDPDGNQVELKGPPV